MATLASLRQQAQAVEVAEPSEPLQTDAEILIGFAQTCQATTLTTRNESSEARKTNSAAKQAGQSTIAHSNSLAVPNHSVPSFVEAAPLTRDLVNIMSPFKPAPEKQAKFHEAEPRFLSSDSKALDSQAAPHRLYDHADSAAAAEGTMPKKPISKQAALPAAIPTSSET